MKRFLFTVFTMFACLMMLQIAIVPSVQSAPLLAAVEAPTAIDPFTELKSKIVPELESILTPEQRAQFEDAISNGTSIKKAFKSVTLTPEQKGKVGMMMKSVPKDYFTSLTPMQKRELFMQKKGYFMEKGKEKAEAAIEAAKEAMTSAAD